MILASAPQTTRMRPGLPSTTALQSPFRGLRYSTVDPIQPVVFRTDVEKELEMLMSAFPMSFQLLPARCFLVALSSAILLDLALTANILSYQDKQWLEDMSLSR